MKRTRYYFSGLFFFLSIAAFLSFLSPAHFWAAPLPPSVSGPADKPAEPKTAGLDPLGRSTPQGTVLGFMKSAAKDDYIQALQYLNTKKTGKAAQELVVALRTFLNRSVSGQSGILSNNPEGYLDDNLPPSQERVVTAESASGTFDILLEQVQRGTGPPFWLFSAETLKQVSERYKGLDTGTIDDYAPKFMVNTWFLGFPLFLWVLVLLLIPLSFGVATLATRLLRPLFLSFVHRIAGAHDDHYVARFTGPLRILIFALAVWSISLFSRSFLGSVFWAYVASTLTIVGATWLCVRLIDIVFSLKQRQLAVTSSSRISVLQLARKLSKILAVTGGILAVMHMADINLAAVLTGLGVGGIAVAFAAQKTLENLFGGIMVASDQPIRVGDFCRAGDYTGTVEDVGLRSTRIRTLDRTVVSVPNGQLAMMSLENFTLRDKIWFHHTLQLRYETTPEQLRYVIGEVRGMMSKDSRVEPSTHRVRLVRLGDFSADVEVFAYILTPVWEDFLAVQEELLFRIADIIKASGTSFAFPSRTIYIGNASDLSHSL